MALFVVNMERPKNKKIFSFLLITIFSVIFAWSVFKFDNYVNDTQEAAQIESDFETVEDQQDSFSEERSISESDEKEIVAEMEPDPFPFRKEVTQLTTTVWIPVWDFNSGLSSLQSKNSGFYSISPVWYSLNRDGTLVNRKNSRWTEIVSARGDTLLIPSIAISDADVLSAVLSDPSAYKTHINSILYEVNTYGYDGIDIDYEMIYSKDKANFRSFIQELRAGLNKSGKTLSLTLLPQWGEDIVYTSFPETRAVQDYKWANSAADEIRIMTYDYNSAGSREPGPIAPITWVENVIKYATDNIERDKLLMGIHLYGYQWSSLGGVKAKTYIQVGDLRNISDFNQRHDVSYAEGVATYTCPEGGMCTLYYQDQEGIKARKELAAKYGLKGVTYWRLGGEGDLL